MNSNTCLRRATRQKEPPPPPHTSIRTCGAVCSGSIVVVVHFMMACAAARHHHHGNALGWRRSQSRLLLGCKMLYSRVGRYTTLYISMPSFAPSPPPAPPPPRFAVDLYCHVRQRVHTHSCFMWPSCVSCVEIINHIVVCRYADERAPSIGEYNIRIQMELRRRQR